MILQNNHEKLRGYLKMVRIFPFYAEALIVLLKIELFWAKFKTQRKIFSLITKEDTEWNNVNELDKINRHIQLEIEQFDLTTNLTPQSVLV